MLFIMFISVDIIISTIPHNDNFQFYILGYRSIHLNTIQTCDPLHSEILLPRYFFIGYVGKTMTGNFPILFTVQCN